MINHQLSEQFEMKRVGQGCSFCILLKWGLKICYNIYFEPNIVGYRVYVLVVHLA